MKKPRCRIPDIVHPSHLIGLTVSRLKDENMMDEIYSFMDEVKSLDFNFTLEDIIAIAEKYMDFYRED